MKPRVDDRVELASFLKARRAELTHSDVGLQPHNRTRARSLRQQDVADMVGISFSYYAALEQGKSVHMSPEILDKISDVLQLDHAQRNYFLHLAGGDPPRPRVVVEEETVDPALSRVVDSLEASPAYVMGRTWNILAWNDAAAAVFGDPGLMPPRRRNLAWWMFTDEGGLKDVIVDWEHHARRVLSQVRADWGEYIWDPAFGQLIEDLKDVSPWFAEHWQSTPAEVSEGAVKRVMHHAAGVLEFEQTMLRWSAAPNLRCVIYTPLQTGTAELVQRWVNGHRSSLQGDETKPLYRSTTTPAVNMTEEADGASMAREERQQLVRMAARISPTSAKNRSEDRPAPENTS